MGKYDDMINMPRPTSGKTRMPIADRAKIFQPFAALKGHEELIKECQKLTVERKSLTEQRKEELDILLGKLIRELEAGNRPEISVVHFITDKKVSKEIMQCLGKYVETIGRMQRIDVLEEILYIGEQRIAFCDIFDIKVAL